MHVCLQASKVEEVPLSNNHLLNVVRIISTMPASTAEVFSVNQSGTVTLSPEVSKIIESSSMLVGQQYYDAKAQLLAMEQQLLRALHFKLALVESQPFTYLFSILRSVAAPLTLIAASVAVMNDVAAFSTCLLDYPPLQLAVACVHVSSQLIGMVALQLAEAPPLFRPGEQHTGAGDQLQAVPWYEAIGVLHADVELLSHAIIDTLQAAHARATAGKGENGSADSRLPVV